MAVFKDSRKDCWSDGCLERLCDQRLPKWWLCWGLSLIRGYRSDGTFWQPGGRDSSESSFGGTESTEPCTLHLCQVGRRRSLTSQGAPAVVQVESKAVTNSVSCPQLVLTAVFLSSKLKLPQKGFLSVLMVTALALDVLLHLAAQWWDRESHALLPGSKLKPSSASSSFSAFTVPTGAPRRPRSTRTRREASWAEGSVFCGPVPARGFFLKMSKAFCLKKSAKKHCKPVQQQLQVFAVRGLKRVRVCQASYTGLSASKVEPGLQDVSP